jgi:hypothetical protein
VTDHSECDEPINWKYTNIHCVHSTSNQSSKNTPSPFWLKMINCILVIQKKNAFQPFLFSVIFLLYLFNLEIHFLGNFIKIKNPTTTFIFKKLPNEITFKMSTNLSK